MSYILEALKRSQAERELGRVPTLEGAALLSDERVASARGPWVSVAVGLASGAVLIALYAVLRAPLQAPSGHAPGVVGVSRVDPAPAVATRIPSAGPARPLPPTPAVPGPQVASATLPSSPVTGRPAARTDGPGVALVPTPVVAQAPGAVGVPGVVPPGGPLIEAPPPKGGARVVPPVHGDRAPVAEAITASTPAALDLEQELTRQLASDPATAAVADELALDNPREDPGPTPVPPELIADIDAFKHQVKGGRGQGKGKQDTAAVAASRPAAAPRPVAVAGPVTTPGDAGDPTQLHLSRDQQAALPKFLLNVHVFSADPGRRFVVINGLRYAQGAKTREGLTVEEIRPEGVVLSHQGHPFFMHR